MALYYAGVTDSVGSGTPSPSLPTADNTVTTVVPPAPDQTIQPYPATTTVVPYTGSGEVITAAGGGGGLQIIPPAPVNPPVQEPTVPPPPTPCSSCGSSPNPPGTALPPQTPSTSKPATVTIAGLPWWVWVLGLVAAASAFER